MAGSYERPRDFITFYYFINLPVKRFEKFLDS